MMEIAGRRAEGVAAIDPILTRVIGSAILAAAEEMGVVLMRTAYSTNIKERGDCSTAIFNVRAETVAQASHVPLHLGALLGLVAEVTRRFPVAGMRPGDMFLANDPYVGVGSQLNDLVVCAPVFVGGEVIAFVANIAHHSDVGGRFPGSEAAEAASIFEEGLRLPIVRLLRDGVLQTDIVEILKGNSRVPGNIDGDLQAQIAANRIGARRIVELCERQGRDAVLRHMDAWLAYSGIRIRQAIAALPEGTWRFSDNMDDDGGRDDDTPPVLHLAITVGGGKLRFDFSGCPPQARNSHNVVLMALMSTVYYASKAVLDPDLPPNAGYYDAIEVVAPRGSVVNAVPPAAVSTRNHTCQKIVDVIMGAFAQFVPERVVAGCGSSKLMIIAGRNPATGRPFVDYEANAGGLGGRYGKDGLDACRAHMTNTSNLPIEALEQEDPLLVERFELIPDSGGPGRFRGGLGARRDVRMLGDRFEHSGFSLGHEFPGPGLHGGGRGRINAPSMLMRNFDDPARAESLHPGHHCRLSLNDLLSVITPGGGGFGDPLDRDPALVAEDTRQGKVSAAAALAEYGVVLSATGAADLAATEALRSRRRAERG
ncbi:MAG: hydantoinase B/oxoprolinase family protein [Variibacter sp.]|nr:hydantoinase B/oxoprolinase family protein [Variibacter sp.]